MAKELAGKLIELLFKKSWHIVFAESCTAGLVSDALARVQGASKVLWGSFVSYVPEAKGAMLGIKRDLIDRCGAVSRETAEAMAAGALRASGADVSASVTGLAGPDGDGSAVSVGTVWITVAFKTGESWSTKSFFSGTRNEIRFLAAEQVLLELLKRLDTNG